MKNLNADAFVKASKRNKYMLVISILLLLITIALVYLGIENENKPLPKEEKLSELLADSKNKENVYSYIDVATKPYLFAVYETDGIEESSKYYLAMDEENYLYIIYMNADTYNMLNVDSISDNPIKLNGITKKIPMDIEELAIESYNELMEDEYLTKDNFQEYIGLLYLDTVTPVNDSSLYYVGAFLSGFFFLLVTVISIVIIIMNKKTLKKMSIEEMEKIDGEISQMANSEYKDMKFYMLRDYIVDMRNNIVIIKYSDILWAYPFEQRYNGLLINKCLKIKD